VGYHVVFLGDLSIGDPAAIQRLLAALVDRFASGELSPLPWRAFDVDDAGEAFRFMAQARHIGKVVVRQHIGRAVALRSDGTVLITGGTGGVARAIAGYLVDRGARHLAVVARRPPEAEAAADLDTLRDRGVDVRVVLADAGIGADLARALDDVRTTMPPLRTVVHAAGINDDAILADQDRAHIEAVLAPKVGGAVDLARLTAADPVELWIDVSSAAAVLGAPAQANYAAANAFVDAEAARQRGGSARLRLSIGFGPWDRVGMTARLDARDLDRMARRGFLPLSASRAVAALDRALAHAAHLPANLLAVHVDPRRLAARPLLSRLRPIEQATTAADLRAGWAATPAALRRGAVTAFVADHARRILGLAAGVEIAPRQPFQEIGLDSLMAVELRNAVGAALGAAQPATLLFDHPTIESLVDHLLTLVVDRAADTPATVSDDPDELADIADLSDAEAEALLLAELGEEAS
jgi:NADP-dependent 3-hydroxy acid dehydrogenase YdfG/acyl carrier protein